MHQRLLAIFAKAPQPGRVKTRLAAETSGDFATRLAAALLFDGVARAETINDRVILVADPPESLDWFTSHFPACELQLQGDGDLGERLTRFFALHADTPVVVLGTDSPNLPVQWIQSAYHVLETRDVVLGPAVDGGYYLVGTRRPIPGLFDITNWGGPTVLEQTVERVRQAKASLGLLPLWYDIDTLEQARFLWTHLKAQRMVGEDPRCPHTERLLNEWFSHSGERIG